MPYARAIFASDWHVPHHDKVLFKNFRRLMVDLKLTKNDQFIFGGDLGDFGSVSSHGDVNPPRLVDEASSINDFIDDVQNFTNRAQVKFTLGNHERRVETYIGKMAPTLQGVASIGGLLKLKERGIESFPYGYVHFVGKLGFTHGKYGGLNHAQTHYQRFGCSLVYGHTHRAQTYVATIYDGENRGAWGQGCMAPKTAPYINGGPTAWSQSFMIAHVDLRTGHFYPQTIHCDQSSFVYDGKVYRGNR